MKNGKSFFETYSPFFGNTKPVTVVEIGSRDINGGLRQVCPSDFEYIGLDFEGGAGVDVILDDPYSLPFRDEAVDIVVSSSCFEHSELFWLVYLEILRILKPGGLFYLNAPSAGSFHRYPVDCWRFYPDSGRALVAWSKRNGGNAALLESFTQIGGGWLDFVAVFIKDSTQSSLYPARILDSKRDFENGQIGGSIEILNHSRTSQSDKKIAAITRVIAG
jgi:SAM-dependent methyltransferase